MRIIRFLLFFYYKNLLDIEKDIMSLVSFSYTTVFCKQVNTGYFLISFSLGNSPLPFAHRRGRYPQGRGHLLLGQPLGGPFLSDDRTDLHGIASFVFSAV